MNAASGASRRGGRTPKRWLLPLALLAGLTAPLNGSEAVRPLVDGEIRTRYEVFHATAWGQGPQDANGYWLQRGLIGSSWRPLSALRGYVQLQSSLESGRNGGPRVTDEDRLDLHQGYVEVTSSATGSWTLRAGRQELSLGSSRLVSVREAPNVRLAFDGVRASWRGGGGTVDALALRPAQTRTGVFDDATDRSQALWGFYGVFPVPRVDGLKADLYLLGWNRERGRFTEGNDAEHRTSAGVRLWGRRGGWDWNLEAVAQTGRFGARDIAAWTLASDTGYTWAALRGRPRLGLKADLASGDADPGDGKLGTFNALYPRGAYFGESALLGPANLRDLHPSVTVQPATTVTLTAEADLFWRDRRTDGLYGPALALLRPAAPQASRYVGTQPALSAEWRPTPALALQLWASRFYAGPSLTATGPAADVTYVSATARWRF